MNYTINFAIMGYTMIDIVTIIISIITMVEYNLFFKKN